MARKPSKPKSASVVSSEWRNKYAKHGGSCGDDLAQRLRGIDFAKLKALAEANEVWDPKYAGLNFGLTRMTVSNRLRALQRAGVNIKWKTARRAAPSQKESGQ